MKKKIVGVVLIVLLLFVGIFYIFNFVRNNDEKYVKNYKDGDVTRYQWMEMLCEEYGMTTYERDKAYYEDVDSENEYYVYVQSAVEWEVLDVEAAFEGDLPASGRFIVLTAMKTVGEDKIQLYLNDEKSITDKEYIDVAIELGLIDEKQLASGLSKEECENLLEKLAGLYFGELWKDNYAVVDYKKNVIELASGDIVSIEETRSKIKVSDDVVSTLDVGDVIVYENDKTHYKNAGRIVEIKSDGSISLTEVELEDVVNELVVSDINDVTVDDIVDYYDAEDYVIEESNVEGGMVNTAVFELDSRSKGFDITVSKNDEGFLEVKLKDNDTGVSYKLPLEYETDVDTDFELEVNVEKICVGAQVKYSLLKGIKYADVAVDANTTVEGKISVIEDEEKILLMETPVPLGDGIIGVDVQIFLVIALDGSVSIEAEIPMQAAVHYEKKKGVRNTEISADVNTVEVEVDCEGSMNMCFEPTLNILECIDVADMQIESGVVSSVEWIIQPNGQECADVSVSGLTLKVSVCGDEKADTLLGELGISAEWEIIPKEKAPIKLGLHYEELKDGTKQFVDECTYKAEANTENVEENVGTSEEVTTEAHVTETTETTETETSEVEKEEGDGIVINDFGHLYGAPTKIVASINCEVLESQEVGDIISWTGDLKVSDDGAGYNVEIGYIRYEMAISAVDYREFIDKATSEDYTMTEDGWRSYNLTENNKITCMGENLTLVSYKVNDAGRGSCKFLGNDGKTYYTQNDISPVVDMFTGTVCLYLYDEEGNTVREVSLDKPLILHIPYGTDGDAKLKYFIDNCPDTGNAEPSGWLYLQFDEEGNIVKITVF